MFCYFSNVVHYFCLTFVLENFSKLSLVFIPVHISLMLTLMVRNPIDIRLNQLEHIANCMFISFSALQLLQHTLIPTVCNRMEE